MYLICLAFDPGSGGLLDVCRLRTIQAVNSWEPYKAQIEGFFFTLSILINLPYRALRF